MYGVTLIQCFGSYNLEIASFYHIQNILKIFPSILGEKPLHREFRYKKFPGTWRIYSDLWRIDLLEEAKKKFAEGKFFLSVPPLTNATEKLCPFLRLAVCLFVRRLSRHSFHTYIMRTKMLMNRISLAFNS